MRFLGRQDELARLREPNWRGQAQLIVAYGRRRVGKTTLIEQAYRDSPLWKFEGLEGGSQRTQLNAFATALARYTSSPDLRHRKLKSWIDAFDLLVEALDGESITPVLFFDEFQWLANMKAGVVALFKAYWDNQLRHRAQLRVVLCGSISSFMVRKVIRSKALYGRVDLEINLKPLNLTDAARFFGDRRSADEILDILLCFSAIPQYFLELNPKLSLLQNLNEYAFSPNGYFFGEYQRLFISHFGKSALYERVVDQLSTRPHTAQQLARACNTKTGGTLTDMLEELALAGFIERYTPLNKGPRSKTVRYRIADAYLHFYFAFIRPYEKDILTGSVRASEIMHGQRFAQWRGFAFERFCRSNARVIADVLRFSGVRYKAGSWFLQGSDLHHGAQVDLLFERADRVLSVCEIKYVEQLQAKKLISDFESKLATLATHYRGSATHKVLLVARPVEIPDSIARFFDDIIVASSSFLATGDLLPA